MIKIGQLNMNKSNIAQSAYLHMIADLDIVLLQEPHIDFLKNSRASQQWRPVYPPRHKDRNEMTRSIIMVNARLSTNCWTAILVDSPDVTGIAVRTHMGTINIFNIYNDQEHDDNLRALARATRQLERQNSDAEPQHIYWAGDFNRHHPLWDDEGNNHLFTDKYLDQAQPLINLLSSFDLTMLLPAGIPTLEASRTKNYTRPDNVFGSEELVNTVVRCDTDPGRRPPNTDHIPVITVLDVSVPLAPVSERRNFRQVDWMDFHACMQRKLEEAPLSTAEIRSVEDFDTSLMALMSLIGDVIQETVPISKPSPFAKRWWSKELDGLRKQVNQLGRHSYQLRSFPEHPVHKEYKWARCGRETNLPCRRRDRIGARVSFFLFLSLFLSFSQFHFGLTSRTLRYPSPRLSDGG